MNKIVLYGGAVILIILVSLFYIISPNKSSNSSLGSVVDAGVHNSTSTDSFGIAVVGSFRTLKTGAGTLGSVIITNETAGSFNLYDATTTASHLDHATTTLMKIYASTAENTYTCDCAFSRGLIMEFQSTNIASSTVTWR